MGGGEGRTKMNINPMQHLKPVISPFFAHLGSMTEADGAVPWPRRVSGRDGNCRCAYRKELRCPEPRHAFVIFSCRAQPVIEAVKPSSHSRTLRKSQPWSCGRPMTSTKPGGPARNERWR